MQSEKHRPNFPVIDGARLQFRWEPAPPDVREQFGQDAWLCHYELVVPLGKRDIRGDDDKHNRVRDELVFKMCDPYVRIPQEGVGPCQPAEGEKGYSHDAPARAAAHAARDREALSAVRIVFITPDGTVLEEPTE